MRKDRALRIVQNYRPKKRAWVEIKPSPEPAHRDDRIPEPDIVRRATGGWLAVSPEGARFKIGVTADTREIVIEKFAAAYRDWLGIARPLTPPPV